MSNIDEIIDRLIKGGPGSGKRGHKSAPAPVNFDSHGNYRKEDYPHQKEEATPVSDTKREMDPDKKKKTLASDRKVARKQVKGHSPEELQSKIDSHKELSESQHLSPASRESYAAKHKALVQIQKKNKKASEISPPKKEEGVATSTPGPFGNIRKGGPGSGKKGHMGVTPDKSTREKNQQKAGEVRDTGREARKIAAELDLSKDDMKEIRDYASAEGISPSQFIVNNKDHIKTNLKKGGPGSGRKGHTTNRDDEPKRREDISEALDDVSENADFPWNSVLGKFADEDLSFLDNKDKFLDDVVGEYKNIADQNNAQIDIDEAYDEAEDFFNQYKESLGSLKKGGPGSGRKGHKTSEGASAAMSDNRRANTEKYLDQLKTSLSLETDPAAKADFEKDIKDIEAELKANKPDEAHDLMSQMKAPGVGSMAKADWEDKIDKSLDTLFYMNQLANQGRIKPKNKRGGRIRKSITDHILEKKQGVPKGVDPAKHERCVMDVKSQGNDKSSAFAICNSSMKKGVEPRLPTDVGPEGPEDDWVVPSVTDKVPPKQSPAVMKGKKDKIEKLAPLAVPAVKTVARVVQNAVKPTEAGKGSDVVPGSPDGPSVAHGSGGAKPSKGPQAPKISKSLAERLDEMLKGGPGSGRKGHSLGSDYGESEHDSVFSSGYDNTGEREAFMDKMKAAVAREEERAEQRIKEKVGKRDATSNISRKGGKKPEKKSFLQRLGQGIIDRI